ncbi:MAG: hypothetical protein GF401_11755 [Chitinivibrionales bacterium]|nr:hypothetical protein [Chitinivibrionales bacterium]
MSGIKKTVWLPACTRAELLSETNTPHSCCFMAAHDKKERDTDLKFRNMANILFCGIMSLAPVLQGAGKLSVEEYQKAHWMTTRMYGGQRSGDGPNWLIMDHGAGVDFTEDADGSYSLAGGWHDCGDHVKFGQTEFYSAYVLLKAYAEFPEGFGDYYSFDYHGYQSSGDFSWEGGRGSPNGIPDILDEVKYATDYFIRCARDNSTFYYQVGEGAKDHKKWVTSVNMATLSSSDGGQPRTVYKNPGGASMASFCGATLALMARVYKKYNSPYADQCLRHALHAYEYAKAHPGTVGAGDGSFYTANARWEDDFVIMTTELYWTTGEQQYLDDAIGKSGSVNDHNWSLCYANNDDLAVYNLAKIGVAGKKNLLNQIVNRYKSNVTAEGVGATGASWGILRYSAGQAFACALNDKLQENSDIDNFIYATIDYILGENAAGQSFVVGFGNKSPQHPHHRNVFLNDNNVSDGAKNSLTIPDRNKQFGLMVGGTLDASSFVDDINQYSYTEGGIDYNSGLVGALGYIISKLAPVDTGESAVVLDGSYPESRENGLSFRIRNNQCLRAFSINGKMVPAIYKNIHGLPSTPIILLPDGMKKGIRKMHISNH